MEIKLNKNNTRVFQDPRTGVVELIIDKPQPMIIKIPIELLKKIKTKPAQ